MNTNATRNHDIERIYMKLLQDTETSVYYLHNKLNRTERQINKLSAPIKKINDPSKPQFRKHLEFDCASGVCFSVFITFAICFYIVHLIFDELFSHDIAVLNGLFYISLIIAVIAVGINIASSVSNYKKAQKEYEKKLVATKNANRKNIQQMKTNYNTALRLSEHRPKIRAEYEKALQLRNDLYNINWIPSRYRNIRVIYYICDMVLTSSIGIEEALKYYLLQETNNKLDEMLRKMDEIIENQNEIIANQAVMNAQNQKIIQQNTSIISQAQQIEENTKLSAEYAQIGARYAEANAYFSLATYLKMK